MNLENLYGSQESLVSVFQSALQQNEPLEVFKRLAAIYQESKKMDVSFREEIPSKAAHVVFFSLCACI